MDFQGLIDLFAENFAQLEELGASVCIWRRGEQVLHLANGYRDREKSLPWTTQTPVLIWSATKGLASACLIHAATEHGIDLNRNVVDLWPEYGTNGKKDTTILHLLAHQAGQAALRDPAVSILDHDAVADQLARQEPFWKPGEAHGYHARTYGFLADELVRRITQGTSLGTYFRLIFGDPLKLDLWIGVPESIAAEVAPIFAPRKDPGAGFRGTLLPGAFPARFPHSQGVFNSRRSSFSIPNERSKSTPTLSSFVRRNRNCWSAGAILSGSLFGRDLFARDDPADCIGPMCKGRMKFSESIPLSGSVS